MRLALSSVCSYLCAFLWNLIKWKWKNKVFARLWKVSYSNKGRERLRLLRLQFHSLRLHQDDKNHYAHVYDSMLLSKAAKINTKIFALVVLSLHHHKHLPVILGKPLWIWQTCFLQVEPVDLSPKILQHCHGATITSVSPTAKVPPRCETINKVVNFIANTYIVKWRSLFETVYYLSPRGGLVRGVWLCYDKIYLIPP